MKILLTAPKEYWAATEAERNAVTGGCGPGGAGDKFVPDKILGVSIFQACRIHDWEYYFGATMAEKKKADNRFRDNSQRIIMTVSKWRILMIARLIISWGYYIAVAYGGGPAFWANTGVPEEEGEVEI
jgi:hypothetical protein